MIKAGFIFPCPVIIIYLIDLGLPVLLSQYPVSDTVSSRTFNVRFFIPQASTLIVL
jgi:hypothetical protein